MDKYFTTVITERGQISVPAAIREKLGLKTGDRLAWFEESDSCIRIQIFKSTTTANPLDALGFAKGLNKDAPKSTHAYMSTIRNNKL